MRNNRLLITYNESERTTKINDGLKESFRCTSLERARKITACRPKHIVKYSVFKDKNGIVTNIV